MWAKNNKVWANFGDEDWTDVADTASYDNVGDNTGEGDFVAPPRDNISLSPLETSSPTLFPTPTPTQTDMQPIQLQSNFWDIWKSDISYSTDKILKESAAQGSKPSGFQTAVKSVFGAIGDAFAGGAAKGGATATKSAPSSGAAPAAPAAPAGGKPKTSNTALYIALGAGGVVLLVTIIALASRKPTVVVTK